MKFPTQPSPKSVSFLPYHQRISNSCRILVYFQIWEKGHLFLSDRWSHSCWNFYKRFGECLRWWLVSVFVTLHSAKYWMKAPKLVKNKKANSRSQSQLQVGKCNFIEIPTGLDGVQKIWWQIWFSIFSLGSLLKQSRWAY